MEILPNERSVLFVIFKVPESHIALDKYNLQRSSLQAFLLQIFFRLQKC